MKRLILITLVALYGIIASPLMVSAVEYGGIGGQPANPQLDNPRSQSIFIYQLTPGQQKSDGVRVYNNTTDTRTIALGAVDSALSSDGAFSCAQEVEAKNDIGSWISLSSSTVIIQPGGSVVVPFTITAPTTASVGEHDGCITMQDTKNQTATKQNGVVLSFRSGIRVAATIPGVIVKDLSITKIATSKDTTGGYLVEPTVKNIGNVSLDTHVVTSLVSLFGQIADTNQGTYPILPRSTASWNFHLHSPFWGGVYKTVVTASFNGTVNAQLGKPDSSSQTIRNRDSGYTLVTPAPLAGIIEFAILLAIIAGGYWSLRKRRHVHHVKHRWHTYEVKSGDMIKHIADKNGIAWKKLATANRLKPPYDLHEGQTLKIPPHKES